MNKTLLTALAATLVLTGCSKQTFVMDNDQQAMAKNDTFFSENILDPHMDATSTKHEDFFLSGIGQSRAINPVKVCGSISRVAKVEVQQNFLQAILSGITFGIYAPRDARVYCR